MNSKHSVLQLVLLFMAVLYSCPSTLAHSKSRKDIPASVSTSVYFKGSFSKVVAFGDSFTDTGNGYVLGTIKTFIKHLSEKSPYSFSSGRGRGRGNVKGKLPGYRLSNGRLVVDYLCDALGMSSLPPYKGGLSANFSSGVNFAIAGSTALSSDFFITSKFNHPLMWQSIPHSYVTQINWFNKYLLEMGCNGKGPNACKAKIQNDLFWVGALGCNDYARIANPSSKATQMLGQLAVVHVKRLLSVILNKGGKYIVVQGLPPTGCQSLALSHAQLSDHDDMGCSASANAKVQAHNALLKKEIDVLRRQYKDAMIVYADYYGAYKSILSNHKKYQFVEPFRACCGGGSGEHNFDASRLCGSAASSTCKDPSKYVNWDGIHLTEAMNRQLADVLFNRGYCYPTFQELLAKKKGSYSHDG